MNINRNKKNRIKKSLMGIILLAAIFALPVTATINIGNFDLSSGNTVNGTLNVTNVTNFFGANINVSYDPTVVIIGNVEQVNPSISVTSNINNSIGLLRIVVDGPLTGMNGDVKLANISFTAVGTGGKSSSLGIKSNQMIDINANDIQTNVINGTFNVNASNQELLSKIIVTPSSAILNIGGYQKFNATVLDKNGNPMSGVNIAWTISKPLGNIFPLNSLTGIDGNASTTFTALRYGTEMVNATNGTISGSSAIFINKQKKR